MYHLITSYSRPHASSYRMMLALALVLLLLPTLHAGMGVQTAAALIPPWAANAAPNPPVKTHLREVYRKLPLSFEENRGQTDKRVKYVSRGSGYTLFLTSTEAVLSLGKTTSYNEKVEDRQADKGAVLRMRLVGGNPKPQVMGVDELPGRVNYLRGDDPSNWRTDVPIYARVQYKGVYPGIDMVYYGNQRQLEYDFIVATGADPSSIRLDYRGADGVMIAEGGDLILSVAGSEVRQHRPLVYQEMDGKRQEIGSRYVLQDNGQVGFELGEYDPALPLIIDPVLSYSTFLGGSRGDTANDIAVDALGNAYIVGYTDSDNFPTTRGALDRSCDKAGKCTGDFDQVYWSDAFVTKLDRSGTRLLYSTYLGGSTGGAIRTTVPGSDAAWAVAVDAQGSAYVFGDTLSSDFPTTPGAFDRSSRGGACGSDAFVAKLDPSGSRLLYYTYLGGRGGELGTGAGDYTTGAEIAIDGSGNAHVTGLTSSDDFPTTEGAIDRTYGPHSNNSGCAPGCSDAFISKLDARGSRLLYSTYLGGAGAEYAHGIALDATGATWVTGATCSTDFPTTPGAFDRSYGDNNCDRGAFSDVFITRLDVTGSKLLYSTYLGGDGSDVGRGIAVDVAGHAYITGSTSSADFPTTPGAYDTILPGVFVAKVSATSSRVLYSTSLSEADDGTAIAVDFAGHAYITGWTSSTDFPTTSGAYDRTFNGGVRDAFMIMLDGTGSSLVYSTYLGGSLGDSANAIAIDSSGNAYVGGETDSANFPTAAGSYDRTYGGGNCDGEPCSDALVVRFAPVADEQQGDDKAIGKGDAQEDQQVPSELPETGGGGTGRDATVVP